MSFLMFNLYQFFIHFLFNLSFFINLAQQCLFLEYSLVIFLHEEYLSDYVAGQLAPLFQLLDTALTFIFPLLILFYCLNINLPFSYRIYSGLQSLSFLIYTPLTYLYYDEYYPLKTFAKFNGGYNLTSRLESLSLNYMLPTLVFACAFIIGMFVLYEPYKVFVKGNEENYSYWQYFIETIGVFCEGYYYVAARQMYYIIGMAINMGNASALGIGEIIILICYGMIIVGVLVRMFYRYRYKLMEGNVYAAHEKVYCYVGMVQMIGLPFAGTLTTVCVVYVVPLGLLVLIGVLNREGECGWKCIGFYVVEVVMAGLPILVLVAGGMKGYLLVGIEMVALVVIGVEVGVRYYGGMSFEKEEEEKEKEKEKEQGKGGNGNEGTEERENENMNGSELELQPRKGKEGKDAPIREEEHGSQK